MTYKTEKTDAKQENDETDIPVLSRKSDDNVPGEVGLVLEVDAQGLNEEALDRLRQEAYGEEQRSRLLAGIVDRIVSSVGDDPFLKPWLKYVFCRQKDSFTSQGLVREEVEGKYELDLVPINEDQAPKINVTLSVDLILDSENGQQSIRLEADKKVHEALCQNEKDPTKQLTQLAKRALSVTSLRGFPTSGVNKLTLATSAVRGATILSRIDQKLLSELRAARPGGGSPDSGIGGIVIEACYEDEGCLCSWCEDIVLPQNPAP